MVSRIRTVALAGVVVLVACADRGTVTDPVDPPAAAFGLVAGDVCDGTGIPVTECEALVSLYNSTDGDNWVDNSGWGVDANPCNWVGVTCSSGSVVRIRLTYNNLSGSIPTGLDDLTNLQELALTGNQLTAPIPADLDNLSGLQSLLLGGNAFGFSIPTALGDITSLEYLILWGNGFTGTIPATFTKLTGLKYLDVSGNKLSGSIPAFLGGLSNLRELNLEENDFDGEIPSELGNLAALEELRFYDNQLTGGIPASFTGLTSLRFMRANDNQLGGLLSLALASFFGRTMNANGDEFTCWVVPGNPTLYMPDVPEYRAADEDGSGTICGLAFSTDEDIGEDTVDEIEELVPDIINDGMANALISKMENAIAKADAGQYMAAINQMQAFINQVEDMVTNGVLTADEAGPLLERAAFLIQIWMAAV